MLVLISPSLENHPLKESVDRSNHMDSAGSSAATMAKIAPTRKRKPGENGESANNVKKEAKKKRESAEGRKNCHQCHQPRETFLLCTSLKMKRKSMDRCNMMFCDVCLKRRYDQSVADILAAGRPTNPTKLLGHVQNEAYIWKCPICSKNCNCYIHRKENGLDPTGSLDAYAKEKGMTVAQLIQNQELLEAAKLDRERRKSENTPKAPAQEKSKVPNIVAVERMSEPKEGGKAQQNPTLKKPQSSTVSVPANSAQKPMSIMPVVTKPQMAIVLPPAPKLFLRCPRPIAAPNFEFIAISHPLSLIRLRLRVREFVLRFEKLLKILTKYVRIINDPNSQWTDLTYKNLMQSLLTIVQADENPILDSNFVYGAIGEISKTSADGPKMWICLKSVLESILHIEHINDFEDEDQRLTLITCLMDLALSSTVIRQQMDKDAAREKEIHHASKEEIKRLKIKWEEEKSELQKERLLKPEDRGDWDERFSKALSTNKKLIAQIEEREWFSLRKTSLRTSPLGVDVLGNTYWLFIQRDKSEEDWGQWIVVEKNPDLPHPSGILPKFDEPEIPPEDDDIPLPPPEDEEVAKARIWFAISGSEEIRQLSDWISYQYNIKAYNKAMEEQHRVSSPAAGPSSAGPHNKSTPDTPGTPSRQLLAEVRVTIRTPLAKIPLGELVTKESTSSLVEQLKRIANFMKLREQGDII